MGSAPKPGYSAIQSGAQPAENKAIVTGVLERGKDVKRSKVRTAVISNRTNKAIQAEVRKHVESGSALYSDAPKSDEGLDEFQHQVIDHAVKYVDGQIHADSLENFWSLVKRGINGTYARSAGNGR